MADNFAIRTSGKICLAEEGKLEAMRTEFITYEEAKQGAERALRNALSELGIHPSVPLLEEKHAENDVCWIFFRNRAISVTSEDAWKSFGSSAAFAVSKWGGLLYVQDNFDDEAQLRIQMDRFATIHPGVRPDKFWQIFGSCIRHWKEPWRPS